MKPTRNKSYFRHSIAARLLRIVFGCYFVITLLVTVVQLLVEYSNTKAKLLSSAREVAHAFSPSISIAVWNYDRDLLRESLAGLVNSDSVVGARIFDDSGKELISVGRVLSSQDELAEYAKDGSIKDAIDKDPQRKFPEELYPYHFSLTRPDSNSQKIGNGVIYSSRSRVLAWVEAGFILIVINSIIKTAALWLIFLVFATRIVARPLNILSSMMDRFDPDHASTADESHHAALYTRTDELGTVYRSFVRLKEAITERFVSLQAVNRASDCLARASEPHEVGAIVVEEILLRLKLEQGIADIFQNTSDSLRIGRADDALDSLLGEYKDSAAVHEAFSQQAIRLAEGAIVFPLRESNKSNGIVALRTPTDFQCTDDKVQFIESIARAAALTLNTIENRRVIEKYNTNLESLVRIRTLEVQEGARRIEAILANVKLGIFTFTSDLKVEDKYSQFLESILERTNLVGTSLRDILALCPNLGTDHLQMIINHLDFVSHDYATSYEVNSHMLPSELEIVVHEGKKAIELTWEPQFGQSDNLERVMVVAKDVTELRSMERESLAQKHELQLINQVLSTGVESFKEFINQTTSDLTHCLMVIDGASALTTEVIHNLFQRLHTIKGGARLLQLSAIANQAHDTERELTHISNDFNDPTPLRLAVVELQRTVDEYRSLYETKLRKMSSGEREKVILKKCADIVGDLTRAEVQANSHLHDLSKVIGTYTSTSLTELANEYLVGLGSLSEKATAKPPRIVIRDGSVRFVREATQALKDILVHFILNSLAHGFEPPEERSKAGKGLEGEVTIAVQPFPERGVVYISYTDDGRGLDTLAIKQAGVRKGLIEEQNNRLDDIVALIFIPAFSSAAKVSDIAGRGVGLNAVVDAIKSLGGSLQIKHLGQVSESGCLPVDWVIELPAALLMEM